MERLKAEGGGLRTAGLASACKVKELEDANARLVEKMEGVEEVRSTVIRGAWRLLRFGVCQTFRYNPSTSQHIIRAQDDAMDAHR